MQKIAGRLKKLRKKAGMTQEQLASAVGIETATYKNYETGRRAVTAMVLRRFAEYYGLSMDYMSALTDIPFALKEPGHSLPAAYYRLPETDRLRIQERMATMQENSGAGSSRKDGTK